MLSTMKIKVKTSCATSCNTRLHHLTLPYSHKGVDEGRSPGTIVWYAPVLKLHHTENVSFAMVPETCPRQTLPRQRTNLPVLSRAVKLKAWPPKSMRASDEYCRSLMRSNEVGSLVYCISLSKIYMTSTCMYMYIYIHKNTYAAIRKQSLAPSCGSEHLPWKRCHAVPNCFADLSYLCD